jgi:hypothetical protein
MWAASVRLCFSFIIQSVHAFFSLSLARTLASAKQQFYLQMFGDYMRVVLKFLFLPQESTFNVLNSVDHVFGICKPWPRPCEKTLIGSVIGGPSLCSKSGQMNFQVLIGLLVFGIGI